ncbi:MAG: YbdK family carboxylate-amine ligase [Solirubrobacterales bacterium]|nr:YbdK family carboxylate-amine ligase [Solirubrobacterales bacterium]
MPYCPDSRLLTRRFVLRFAGYHAVAMVLAESEAPDVPTASSFSGAAFEDHAQDLTLGVEEELMLLDAGTLQLAPVSAELLRAARGDRRYCAELPAAQIELVSPVCAHAGQIEPALVRARRDLLRIAAPDTRLAGAGTHAFAAPEGPISDGPRYARIADEYQWAARRGLAWGLHVHVAIRGAARAVAVHDAVRSHLPELAALAGNAPFHDGADTGLHSVRPKLAEGFPRQGVPPAWGTWTSYTDFLTWGSREGAFTADGRQLWWEVRLHPGFGTLEVRVCDQPATAAESAALAAVVQALCSHLGDQHDAGALPPPASRERIEENRWRALRHGLEGTLLDLETGEAHPTRARVGRLLAELAPHADRLGSGTAFARAWGLLHQTGAQRQRNVAAATGELRCVVDDLATRLEDEAAGPRS